MADLKKRDFWLQDYSGRKFELLGSEQTSPFLYKPGGLGITFDVETVKYLNQEIIKNVEVVRPNITGTMFFTSYSEYQSFNEFVLQAQSGVDFDYKNPKTHMRLYYQTQEKINGEVDVGYYEVFMIDIDKTEKDEENGILFCPIIFKRLSNYKTPITVVRNNGLDPEDLLGTFPLPTNNEELDTSSTPFIQLGLPDQVLGQVRFTINYEGNFPVPGKLTINGAYSNPTWTNSAGGSGGYSLITATPGNILIIDSNIPESITENGNNAYQSQDKFKENFVTIYPGYNQIIVNLGQQSVFTSVELEYAYEKWTH